MLIKIQLGSTIKTGDGEEYTAGQEVDLPDTVAQACIDGGSALAVVVVADAPTLAVSAEEPFYAVASEASTRFKKR